MATTEPADLISCLAISYAAHFLAARVKLDHINVKLFCSILSCLSVHKILHEINQQSDIQTSDIMYILSGSDRPATIYLPHCRAPVDNCIQI